MISDSSRSLRLLETLAEGAFGLVCVAELKAGHIERTVALKILKGEWADHEEVLSRTRDEARLLALLNHRNIVKVEHLTSMGGRPTLVMEYVPGTNLEVVVREEGPLSLSVSLAVTGQVCAALDAAYNRPPPGRTDPLRVVHRDIKPSNILLGIDAEVKVLDFGTARADFDRRESRTQKITFGSIGYLAPERLEGFNDEPSSDIYALGATLYEILSGQPLGQLSIRPDRHARQLQEKVEAIRFVRGHADVEPATREMLLAMLAYEPELRPSAADLIRCCWELDAALPSSVRESVQAFAARVVEPIYHRRSRLPPPEGFSLGIVDPGEMENLSGDLVPPSDPLPARPVVSSLGLAPREREDDPPPGEGTAILADDEGGYHTAVMEPDPAETGRFPGGIGENAGTVLLAAPARPPTPVPQGAPTTTLLARPASPPPNPGGPRDDPPPMVESPSRTFQMAVPPATPMSEDPTGPVAQGALAPPPPAPLPPPREGMPGSTPGLEDDSDVWNENSDGSGSIPPIVASDDAPWKPPTLSPPPTPLAIDPASLLPRPPSSLGEADRGGGKVGIDDVTTRISAQPPDLVRTTILPTRTREGSGVPAARPQGRSVPVVVTRSSTVSRRPVVAAGTPTGPVPAPVPAPVPVGAAPVLPAPAAGAARASPPPATPAGGGASEPAAFEEGESGFQPPNLFVLALPVVLAVILVFVLLLLPGPEKAEPTPAPPPEVPPAPAILPAAAPAPPEGAVVEPAAAAPGPTPVQPALSSSARTAAASPAAPPEAEAPPEAPEEEEAPPAPEPASAGPHVVVNLTSQPWGADLKVEGSIHRLPRSGVTLPAGRQRVLVRFPGGATGTCTVTFQDGVSYLFQEVSGAVVCP